MKLADLRDKSIEELGRAEREHYDQLFKLRFQLATNQIENPSKIRFVRKELARLKTVLNEKKRAENMSASAGVQEKS